MAIIKVSIELDCKDWFKELMNREFDEIERLTGESNVNVYRVQHPELPTEDKQISFDALFIEGVKPFITEFEVW